MYRNTKWMRSKEDIAWLGTVQERLEKSGIKTEIREDPKTRKSFALFREGKDVYSMMEGKKGMYSKKK